MAINLPNQITIARLMVAIVLFVLLGNFELGRTSLHVLDVAAGVFIVAALSDALDGYLARRQNQVTSFGRVLDPFVDKVLVCGSFILFCGPGFVDPDTGRNVSSVETWMVVLIVGRELLVTGLRGFSESQGDAFGANVFGKAKMVVQSVAVPVVLLLLARQNPRLRDVSINIIIPIIVWLTIVVTTLSIIAYLIRAKNILKEMSRR